MSCQNRLGGQWTQWAPLPPSTDTPQGCLVCLQPAHPPSYVNVMLIQGRHSEHICLPDSLILRPLPSAVRMLACLGPRLVPRTPAVSSCYQPWVPGAPCLTPAQGVQNPGAVGLAGSSGIPPGHHTHTAASASDTFHQLQPPWRLPPSQHMRPGLRVWLHIRGLRDLCYAAKSSCVDMDAQGVKPSARPRPEHPRLHS